MANDIENKELFNRGLKNITQSDWIKAAGKLGISVLMSQSGTSHYLTLRDPIVLETNTTNGLITTITPNSFKEANRSIFKRVLEYCRQNGKTENDIWKALGLVK